MAEQQSKSRWVWVFLILILGCFTALIIFLDQKVAGDRVTPQTGKSIQQNKNKPTIDFYTVLPDRTMDIPISDLEREAIKNPSINKESGDKVFLQVGSFQSVAEADSLKAELAFLGLQARIQSAQVNSDTWHRVQLGPFLNGSELSRTKNILLGNKIKYMQRSANAGDLTR